MNGPKIDSGPGASCPYCERGMAVRSMACSDCGVEISGDFSTGPLARLPEQHQRFIEMLVLASGSLKAIAAHAGVSYPTVRSRFDRVIEALREEIERSSDGGEEGLGEAEAARMIKAI